MLVSQSSQPHFVLGNPLSLVIRISQSVQYPPLCLLFSWHEEPIELGGNLSSQLNESLLCSFLDASLLWKQTNLCTHCF